MPGFFEPWICGWPNSHRFLVILQAFSIAWPIGIGKLPPGTARLSRQSAENQKPCV
jgi:hypothetical protein